MSNPRTWPGALGALAAGLLLTGCGGAPNGTVTGKVSYQGEPVTLGSISFHMPERGIAQDAKLNAAGEFTMAAPLPIGSYKVYYVPPSAEPQDPARKTVAKVPKIIVPLKYHGLEGSNLSVEVKAGKNPITVDFR